MNVNSMYKLMGAVQKDPKLVGNAVANGAGFENMLQQASQKPAESSKPQAPAKDKPADNQKPVANQKPEQTTENSQTAQNTQPEQGKQENQQALAASLVTSQPVPVILPVEEAPNQVETAVANVALNVNAPVVNGAEQQAAVVMPQTPAEAQGQLTAEPVMQQVQTLVANSQAEPEAVAQTMPNMQNVVATPQETASQAGQTLQNVPNAETQPQLQTPVVESNTPQQNMAEEGGEDAAAAMQTPVFGNNEAVPVKVMEAEQPLNPQADDAAEQLAQKINQALNQGESRVTINLTPANLGSMTVEITRLNDGTLSVILSAVTEKAAGLLDKHSNSLQALLAGTQQGQVRVEVENRLPEQNDQQFLNPDQQERHEQQNQEQRRQQNEENSAVAQADFMQQLRLGLIDIEKSN